MIYIHLCGKGNVDSSTLDYQGYKQFEYVTDELPHLLAASNLAVSRAGSNAIFELLALRIPMLLIPLSAAQSRGDQLLNAEFFKSIGTARVLQEEELALRPFSDELIDFKKDQDKLIQQMLKTEMPKTPKEMVTLIMAQRV